MEPGPDVEFLVLNDINHAHCAGFSGPVDHASTQKRPGLISSQICWDTSCRAMISPLLGMMKNIKVLLKPAREGREIPLWIVYYSYDFPKQS